MPAPNPAPAEALPVEASAVRAAEQALRDAVVSLDGPAYEALLREVVEVSMAEGLTWERPTGGYDPVPLMLRPRVWAVGQAAHVQRASLAVQAALGRLLRLWLEEPAAREVLPLNPYEERKVRELAQGGPSLDDAHLFARLDAIIDPASDRWADTLAFLEPNVVGVGGTRYTALGEKVWMQAVLPRLAGAKVEPMLDSRQLLLDHLVDRARALGVQGPVRIALVEDLRDLFGTNELRQIADYFTRCGHPGYHVDVRTLSSRGEQLYADGKPVDLVYRFPELRELEELDDGRALEALWLAFARNRVVSTLGGDFDHKSAFEIFTAPRWASLFTAEQRALLQRHVLWTRLVGHRRTEGPRGEPIDLPEYVRRHRAELVLKPNRSYGGDGVTIGPELSDADWGQALDAALAQPGAWVVQSYRPLPRQVFPVRAGDRWADEERVMVSGFYATPRGVTSMGRVSRQSVVNLSRQGSALVPQVKIRGG